MSHKEYTQKKEISYTKFVMANQFQFQNEYLRNIELDWALNFKFKLESNNKRMNSLVKKTNSMENIK